MKATRFVSCLALLAFAVAPSRSNHPLASFREIAQTADLVFIGTVDRCASRMNEGGKMIVTDVFFRQITVLHGSNRSRQAGATTVRLTHAGGTLREIGVHMSGVPRFVPERRYVVFMLDDGNEYATPVIAGEQGLFRVDVEPSSGRSVILTCSGRPVTGLIGPDLQCGPREPGLARDALLRPPASSPDNGVFNTPPVSATPGDVAYASENLAQAVEAKPAVSLEEFVGFVRTTLAAPPPEERVLKMGGTGVWWERRGEEMVATEIPPRSAMATSALQKPPTNLTVPLSDGAFTRAEATPHTSQSPLGTILQTCGYHDRKIVMEQVSTGDMTYAVNNDCMWMWNQFMDLFRYIPDDGTYGDYPRNLHNEFVGFLSDAEMYAEYGYHWGTSIGLTALHFNPGDPCGLLLQTDVMLNSGSSWTNDALYSYDHPGTYLVRRVIMHELGHVWGLADGYDPELYDYDVPTVMHAHSQVIEDGWGIHRSDAYLLRRLYKPLTPVIDRIDVGVESYYASGGLKKSSFLPTWTTADQSLKLNNVTVENMSTVDVTNVRLRFYLSSDRTITTSDYLMGSYFEWSVFPAETQDVSSYTVRVPGAIPPGMYYVGAIVTVNGFAGDDLPSNNTTFFVDRLSVLAPPEITISDPEIDLGARYASSPFSSSFTIANPGTWTYDVTLAESSLAITSLSPTTFTALPGSKTTVNFSGKYPSAPGSFTAPIAVKSPVDDPTVLVSGFSVVNPPGFTRILSGPIATDKATSVGVAWGDFDADGKEDLYVANFYGNNALYKNFGSGVFRKVSTGPPVNDGGNSNAATWGDYDNDGDLDLFVANGGSEMSMLYRNEGGGIFTNVPSTQFPAGKADARGCSWVDYDNDGHLDLFVAGYGNNSLFRNNGNGTFTRVDNAPIGTTGGSSTCGAWSDLDNDGDQDLLVTNYYIRNFLFTNNGDGTFTQVTGGPLVADSGYTRGASWGDYDNDGLMDLYITHTNRYRNSLFHNEGGGVFTKVTTGVIANDSLFSEGSTWLDYNNDGYLDLFVARGGPGTSNEVLYRGYGNGTFARVMGPTGEFWDRGMSFGCASADYDDDGDMDVAVVNASEPFLNYLYSNDGTAYHWLKIRCLGFTSNRSAIGARVTVRAMIGGNTVQQTREISGQSGSCGQNSLTAHFGLRDATVADEITVRWPSGAIQTVTGQPVDRLITIEEKAVYLPPVQLTALGGYKNAVPLAWKPPAGAVAQQVRSYTLSRFSKGGTLPTTVNNITRPYYRDQPVNAGEPFTYTVSAVYDAAVSPASIPVQVQAPSAGYAVASPGSQSVPRLDGVITPGEWSGATTVNVTAPGSPGPATLYIMNAANMLFLAVDDAQDLTLDSNDTFGVFVDSDGNREWPRTFPSGEGLLQLYQSGSTGNAASTFLGVRGQWPAPLLTDAWRPPGGVYQKISSSRGHVQYEGGIHLGASPVRSAPGAVLGCLFYIWNAGGSTFTGLWPQETVIRLPPLSSGYQWAYAPFSYGDVTLGASSAVGVEITFAVTVPRATPATDTVFLAGDFNFWDPGPATAGSDSYHHDLRMIRTGERQWTLTLPFKKGETIGYKYTRGAWASVEKGTQGEEIANRTLTIPDTGAVRLDAVARWADVVDVPGNLAEDIPREFTLGQNYPNPFNPTTVVGYQLPVASQVNLVVYDLLGREVAVLVNERQAAGRYEVSFDASGLPSGMYLYRLRSPAFVQTRKLVLTR